MASKPVLFAVDDDPEVLRAVERDLRRKYGRSRNGGGYRILRADSAEAAMDALGCRASVRTARSSTRCGPTSWTTRWMPCTGKGV